MLERERLESKTLSKTRAAASQLDAPLAPGDVQVGPSDHVPWLTDRTWAHIRLEGTAFGGAPLTVELKLEVWDSPNSAGIVIDAVRCSPLAGSGGVAGAAVRGCARGLALGRARGNARIDSVMLWNEPNDESHGDPEIDPDWLLFAEMAKAAGHAIRDVNPHLIRVLGNLSPIDPVFIRHKEAEGSSYDRHFHRGLLRQDGTPKIALESFARHTPEIGLCQWFPFEDRRLDAAVAWMKRPGVRHLRTGLSWADSFRPGALDGFDRQMAALQDFDVTVTFCFTPEHRGISPHHTSAPLVRSEYAAFCAAMVRRYAPGAPG